MMLRVLVFLSVLAGVHSTPPSRPALRVRQPTVVQEVVPQCESKPVSHRVVRGGAVPQVELPRSVALLLGSAGIFLSFSVFAVLQEDVYKKAYGGEYFAFTFFALLLERGINALVALIGMQLLGKSGLQIPHKDIFNSGVSQMLAMAASNEALRYVSYPTQVRARAPAVCVWLPTVLGAIACSRAFALLS